MSVSIPRLKKGEVIKKVLSGAIGAAAVLGLVAALVVMPGFGLVLKDFADWYKKQDRYRRHQARRTFFELRRKRLIEIKETSKGTEMILTEGGRRRLLKYQVDVLRIIPRTRWDRKWRMVIFDIPERHKRARRSLREKLREWGFYPLQKSVWIYPHECRNELDFLIEYWGISPYVRLVEVTDFDGADFLKRDFDLEK